MYAKIFHVSIKDLRICANNPVLEDFVSKIIIRNFCACTQKSSTSLLRICVYAQIIQCWKTLLSKIIIRNFCACTQKSSTSLLRICVYAQKIQQMIITKSSNNPIVDVLRPAQKLQVWNTYIPAKKQKFTLNGSAHENLPEAFANNKGTDQPAESDQCNCDS